VTSTPPQVALIDLDVRRGSEFVAHLSPRVDGVALDLTGYTARMQVREWAYATAPILWSGTTEDGALSINTTTDKVTITISALDTADLPVGIAVYDVEVALDPEHARALIAGRFLVSGDVTRDDD
jgi:hypothetical protein